jgi:AraC-like DNA-binding protein
VIDAFRSHAELSFFETFEELFEALRARVEAPDVVIVPTQDTEGRSVAERVREMAAERPMTAIVAYCPPGHQYSADVRALTAAGAHQIVLAGITDEGIAFRSLLTEARRVCAGEIVMRQLEPVVPALLHRVAEAIVSRPSEITSLPELTRHLRVHRRTLFNWCKRAGPLPPAELLVWCRLALVGHHLVNSGCTVETISVDMGFPSDNALRNALKRYTGLTATGIRRRGGTDAVVAALRRRLTGAATLHVV